MFYYFFLHDPATTEIYTLSLHDALPISADVSKGKILLDNSGWSIHHALFLVFERKAGGDGRRGQGIRRRSRQKDRKSTRLNSSHGYISYAVFCLKKKKKTTNNINTTNDT